MFPDDCADLRRWNGRLTRILFPTNLRGGLIFGIPFFFFFRTFIPQMAQISADGFLSLFVGRCPTLNATRPLALDDGGRKIFRPYVHVRPCTFNCPLSTLN